LNEIDDTCSILSPAQHGPPQITAQAGAQSLDAGSDLWAIFRDLEGYGSPPDIVNRAQATANKLRNAAELYRGVLAQVGDESIAPLSPAELEVAAFDLFEFDFSYYPFARRNILSGLDTPREFYQELITRLQTLAASLANLNLFGSKESLAPTAFQIMRLWERLAVLARVIAVINRRERRG
jgi:hypothetical protein